MRLAHCFFFWKVVGHFVVDWLKIIANCSCLREYFFFLFFFFLFLLAASEEKARMTRREALFVL
jgi:hypothetical protein